uniref:Uncharacterized protein n=1 Tax=Acrobeloides nanus TaxID=290746 RepID=A0A914CCR7_9BILA
MEGDTSEDFERVELTIDPVNKANVVVADYLTKRIIHMSSDPSKFWDENQELYEPLPILVRKYHSAPIVPVPYPAVPVPVPFRSLDLFPRSPGP